MNRFVRITAVAVALFAGAAQAVTLDLDDVADATALIDLAEDEFATANTMALDGNAAFIVQEAVDGQAYIKQTGETNFAAIIQQVDLSLAVIVQSGDNNRAMIVQ